MHDGTTCFESSHLGCHIIEGPESHGSTRIENVPGAWNRPGGESNSLSGGEKVMRKVVSALICLIPTDITCEETFGSWVMFL